MSHLASLFVHFLFVFDFSFILFRITWWKGCPFGFRCESYNLNLTVIFTADRINLVVLMLMICGFVVSDCIAGFGNRVFLPY